MSAGYTFASVDAPPSRSLRRPRVRRRVLVLEQRAPLDERRLRSARDDDDLVPLARRALRRERLLVERRRRAPRDGRCHLRIRRRPRRRSSPREVARQGVLPRARRRHDVRARSRVQHAAREVVGQRRRRARRTHKTSPPPPMDRLWVPRYDVASVAVLDACGARNATLDISSYDSDGNPNASAIVIDTVAGAAKAFVALERLDDHEPTLPSLQPSEMLRFDVATKTVDAVVTLAGRNPFGLMREYGGGRCSSPSRGTSTRSASRSPASSASTSRPPRPRSSRPRPRSARASPKSRSPTAAARRSSPTRLRT